MFRDPNGQNPQEEGRDQHPPASSSGSAPDAYGPGAGDKSRDGQPPLAPTPPQSGGWNGYGQRPHSGYSDPYFPGTFRSGGTHHTRAPRRSRGPWIFTILLVLVLAGATVTWFLSEYTISIASDDGGFRLQVTPRADPSVDPAPSQAPTATLLPTVSTLPSVTPMPVTTPAGGEEVTMDVVPIPRTPTPSPTQPDGREVLSVAQIAKKVTASVVGVVTEIADQYGVSTSTGSGVIMRSDGYIITNQHVIDGATSITVVLDNGNSYQGLLLGGDAYSDLAVIKIDARNLQAAEFGDSEMLEVGDLAVAIGNPMGLELQSTVTSGIISAINRDLMINDRMMTMLQTDASINPGNSGGPLINQYGQVIGITSSKVMGDYFTYVAEGLGFAIPMNAVKPIVEELIAQGYVKGHPAIGISGRDITERYSNFYRLPRGMLVEYVNPNSDAYAKGLQVGDIITAVNGTEVTTRSELNAVKNELAAGDTIRITVYREGAQLDFDVMLMDEGELNAVTDVQE